MNIRYGWKKHGISVSQNFQFSNISNFSFPVWNYAAGHSVSFSATRPMGC